VLQFFSGERPKQIRELFAVKNLTRVDYLLSLKVLHPKGTLFYRTPGPKKKGGLKYKKGPLNGV